MNKLNVISKSSDETHDLGEKIGKLSQAGMVILLDGDLGAGKTCLTQGIAKGLGITRSVTSPTFTIQKIYHGRLLLNHIDAYRLEGIHQDLGFDEYMNDEGLTVIEWSNFSPELVPDERLTISITLLENGDRNFSFEAIGKQYEDLLEALA
ncbi:MAG: tRNA (adenosine(37)-N6)-threonylcarbamoyltransferase complex ATPase subunit type 1 TsaE [Erysipelotrichaceae bacterium]|nr:tRNA (adenosine(37)-N6)-threonylcarbamoyltransferase complex ATPase subunit type 1 TsaE [Erysipelotrichaceae bacterium]MDY6034060.1 tRNA (adenosine(37)-N6)-threonylcarbamoyltransferase complex ATPase subunit type 1 TsaE [Bulleidia sp.]